MVRSADILVVGLGAVGSAALYQAAKLGARSIGVDRFHPPHDRGSSHGETRITRQAIGEGREYVPLVLRSNQIWEELEAASGRSLLTRNGTLILQSPHIVGDHHGSASFLVQTIAVAEENKIEHEALNSAEISQRFPQFRLDQEERGYFEPGGGFLRPEACVETQLALAKNLGAEVHTSETVLSLKASFSSVEVTTDRDSYSVGQAILTAGPWIGELLPASIAQQLVVYRQVMTWFALARNPQRYAPQKFPVFIWITGDRPCDMFYGFPAIDGTAGGIKTATERYDVAIQLNDVDRTVADSEVETLYNGYIASRLPDLSARCIRSATCLYTVAPGARFVIDQADEGGRILFASACSGHGFKHSAAVGEALARRATGLQDLVDLEAFRVGSHFGAGAQGSHPSFGR
jgi:sarcosine oxidase